MKKTALKQRFGNPNVIISRLLEKLINCRPPSWGSTRDTLLEGMTIWDMYLCQLCIIFMSWYWLDRTTLSLSHQSELIKDHRQHHLQVFLNLVRLFLDLIECWMTAKRNIHMYHSVLFCRNCLEQDNDLKKEVFHWWKAEVIRLQSKVKMTNPEVLVANKIPNTTCARKTNETGLLWKDNSSLPDNRSQFMTLLNHRVNRLQTKPEHYKRYNEGHQANPEKCYIAKVQCINRKTQDVTYLSMVLVYINIYIYIYIYIYIIYVNI